MLEQNREDLRKVLLRALNKNQILILEHVDDNSQSITFALKRLSDMFGVPLSTLKLNARILKGLGLIDFGNSSDFKKPRITEIGKIVMNLIERGD